jgi:hypothetical protein
MIYRGLGFLVDLAPPPPLPLVSLIGDKLPTGEWGSGWVRSRIIRLKESLLLIIKYSLV